MTTPLPFATRSATDIILDPWLDVFLCALQGWTSEALDNMQLLERRLPKRDLSRLYAISARTLLAIGRSELAEQTLERALVGGSREAAALASVVGESRERWCRARCWAGPEADRADALCDVAALRLEEGDLAAAAAGVEEALYVVPGHAEALHWRRFLSIGQTAVELFRQAHARPPELPAEHDAAALAPEPRLGMLSRERLVRRLGAAGWVAPADGATALGRLQAVGCVSRMVGTDEDYSRLPADHPLSRLEEQVDLAGSLEAEGREVEGAARRLWNMASRLDEVALRDAAQYLVALGVRDPSCARVGLGACVSLCSLEPEQVLWRAYKARLLSELGRPSSARRAARAILELPPEPALQWLLALEALRRVGNHEEARRAAERWTADPDFGPMAREVLATWSTPVPVLPHVTERLTSRSGHGEN